MHKPGVSASVVARLVTVRGLRLCNTHEPASFAALMLVVRGESDVRHMFGACLASGGGSGPEDGSLPGKQVRCQRR